VTNYHFGGENMDNLASLGIFFAGIGVFFLGCGLFWFVSEYSKKNKK
jgi:hypothetical protein